MSRQEKAVSERHTRALRELVKQPENKVCADCKRNDPRWASWNLGVFLCIRCSGIHRSMGTHISKVKSVDLDIWTPEQMASIQSWGNRRANLYWEAHLKPGHIPPEHKMESFVRSKYESRRWALEGPPPKDPSVLESGRESYSEPAPKITEQPAAPARPAWHTQPVVAPPAQLQPHTLLSSQVRSTAPPPVQSAKAPAAAPQAAVSSLKDDIFSLDFHSPPAAASNASTATSSGAPKNVKNEILSLFSTAPGTGTGVLAAGFNAPQVHAVSQAPISMMGNSGTGMWGAQSGWTGLQSPPLQGNIWGQSQSQQTVQSNVWGPTSQPQPQQQFGFGAAPVPTSQNAWAAGTSQPAPDLFSNPFATTQPAKKDDAFGDLWGNFK